MANQSNSQNVSPIGETPRHVLLLAFAWRGFYYFVLPGAVTFFAIHYALPVTIEPHSRLARLVESELSNPIVSFVLVFLVLSSVARYWRHHLPGYRLTSSSPKVSTRKGRTWVRWIVGFSACVTLAMLLRLFFFQSYVVVGNSMLPNLSTGDRVIVRPAAYLSHPLISSGSKAFDPPRRGDIVVLENPTSTGEARIIKRVIGLPGDEVSTLNGLPVINGWPIPHCDAGPYASVTQDLEPIQGRAILEFLGDSAYLTLYEATKPALHLDAPYFVKPNEVFVLGDNRNASSDSRSWSASGVPLSHIHGRVDRLLSGAHPDGTTSLSLFLGRIDLRPRLEGMDISPLLRRIQACLNQKPLQTSPPARSMPTALAPIARGN